MENKQFTYSEVQGLIQTIWSEFAELSSEMQTAYFLRHIIETEIEKHPLHPVQVFTPESRRVNTAEQMVEQNKAKNEIVRMLAEKVHDRGIEHFYDDELRRLNRLVSVANK